MISSESDTKNVEVKTPTLRDVLLAQPLNPIVQLVFKVVPTREGVDKPLSRDECVGEVFYDQRNYLRYREQIDHLG